MDGEAWQVIRLGSGGAHVDDCAHDLGVSSPPDFARLPPVAEEAPGVAACTKERVAETYAALVVLLRDEGGAAAVRAFLAATSDQPVPGSASQDDEEPWMKTALALPPEERAAVLADVCPALTDGAKSTAYVRAARACPVDDARVADAALDRVRASLAGAPPPYDAKWPAPIAWAMPLALARHAADAGAAACAFLGAPPGDAGLAASDVRVDLALGAVAVSKTACPAVRALPAPCGSVLDCDAGLCAAADVAHDFDAWLAAARAAPAAGGAGVRPREPAGFPHGHAAVAALLAQGPLAHDVVLRNARRSYEQERQGDTCGGRMPNGAPCDCPTFGLANTDAFCDLPLDGGVLLPGYHCAVRADDKAKRVVVTNTCPSLGAPDACAGDRDCCEGARCAVDAGGTCVAAP
jgi:hypothetical protein